MEENLSQNKQTEPLRSNQNQRRFNGFNSRSIFSQFADNSGHILEVLKAAMPYIDSRRLGSMEALLKATDLIHTTHNMTPGGGELSAASLNTKAADVEGMLCSVREVGSPMERDFIDRMLNLFKAKKFYQTYRTFQQNRDVLKSASLNGNPGQYGGNSNFMEALKSILPPDQAASLDQIQMMMNMMNAMNSGSNYNNNTNNSYNTNSNNNFYNQSQTSNQQQNNYSSPFSASSQQNRTGYSVPKAPIPSSSNWQVPPAGVPNYTYQMNQNANHPVLDTTFINQFAPSVPAPTSQPQSNAPSQGMDPASMTQMYNNISNIIAALQAAGITPNGNASNLAAGQQAPQNNMLNALTALANSGLLNNLGMNNSSSQNNSVAPNNTTAASTPAPAVMTPNTMHSMPIPAATTFDRSAHNTSDSDYNPEELYQRQNSFNTQYGLKSYRPLRDSSEQLEAASLDKE